MGDNLFEHKLLVYATNTQSVMLHGMFGVWVIIYLSTSFGECYKHTKCVRL
jgi:hypothetical protein